jgi:hypothetical protein
MNQKNQKMIKDDLVKRWNGKTPEFWKRMQRWAIITGSIAGAIVAAPIALPVGVITVAGYIATVSATIATTSQLTVVDSKN